MPRSTAENSVGQVRDSVKRLRSEGERFMGQIRRETTTFARRARAEIDSDVRKVRDELRSRADWSLKDLETRGRRLVESFEKQLSRLADAGRTGTAGGGLEELTKLSQRLGTLEQRVEHLEHELREALQDQEVWRPHGAALSLGRARFGGRDAPVPIPFAPEDGLAARLLANMRSIEGRHVLMVIAPADFRDEELLEPKALLEAEGAVVEIASTTAGLARGMQGADVKPDLTIEAADPHRYAAIVVVGGAGAPTYLWENGTLHALLRVAHADGIPVAAICLSGAVLARAGLLRGLRATVYGLPRAKHELLRGGALYVEDDVVVDGGVVTAAGPHAAREFARAVVREMAGEHQRAARSRSHPAPRR